MLVLYSLVVLKMMKNAKSTFTLTIILSIQNYNLKKKNWIEKD